MRADEIEARKAAYSRLRERAELSITGAKSAVRASEYVANALTAHEEGTVILAECAVLFARSQVEALLARPTQEPAEDQT